MSKLFAIAQCTRPHPYTGGFSPDERTLRLRLEIAALEFSRDLLVDTGKHTLDAGERSRLIIPALEVLHEYIQVGKLKLDRMRASEIAGPKADDPERPFGCSSDCRAPGCGGGCSQ